MLAFRLIAAVAIALASPLVRLSLWATRHADRLFIRHAQSVPLAEWGGRVDA